jgi:hypothetical protein
MKNKLEKFLHVGIFVQLKLMRHCFTKLALALDEKIPTTELDKSTVEPSRMMDRSPITRQHQLFFCSAQHVGFFDRQANSLSHGPLDSLGASVPYLCIYVNEIK